MVLPSLHSSRPLVCSPLKRHHVWASSMSTAAWHRVPRSLLVLWLQPSDSRSHRLRPYDHTNWDTYRDQSAAYLVVHYLNVLANGTWVKARGDQSRRRLNTWTRPNQRSSHWEWTSIALVMEINSCLSLRLAICSKKLFSTSCWVASEYMARINFVFVIKIGDLS